ncbi:hypothetical protein [Rhodoplanes sp. Z2-YC6860]|uniref:hypothetical protein n=1 Tax=Rhodoplanes sp. Z2-YC6860 TaxID=674703 RepID=UPI00083263D5|nr:hypothetical protein [Rhodoplanes sp. Z2-YC6860]
MSNVIDFTRVQRAREAALYAPPSDPEGLFDYIRRRVAEPPEGFTPVFSREGGFFLISTSSMKGMPPEMLEEFIVLALP